MQALEASASSGAADAAGQLGSKRPLVRLRVREAAAERGVVAGRGRPALDSPGRLEPRDRGDEVRARQPVRGRKRSSALVERTLLGDGGNAERAALDDRAKRARSPSELSLYELPVGLAPMMIFSSGTMIQ